MSLSLVRTGVSDFPKEQSENLLSRYLYQEQYPLWLALHHHRTHTNKRMTFKNHLYLLPILSDSADQRVVMKSTQGGFSECLCIISWAAAKQGKVVVYVLPTHQLMERFVSNRFEKSMSYTGYYRKQRTSEKSKDFKRDVIDNRSLKDIGAGVINFVGSGSDIPFIEIPADWLIVDEADKCDAKRLEMGKERLGHSLSPVEIYAGNPTYTGSFLDTKFKESTMSLWTIRGDCGHFIQPDFFKHVLMKVGEQDYAIRDKSFRMESGEDVRLICDQCGKPVDRFGEGEYVPQKKSWISGKQFSRLFSGNSTLLELVDDFMKALYDDYKMQRFYNSNLGLPYTSKGAKISKEMLDDCIGDYFMPDSCEEPCIAGVDIGMTNNIVVSTFREPIRVVYIGTEKDLLGILSVFKRYNVRCFVVDAQPERREALKLCHRWKFGLTNFYVNSKRDITVNPDTHILNSNRTMALDAVKETVLMKSVHLPKNAPNIEGFYEQMQASTRVFDEEKEEYRWEHGATPDHYHHAFAYMMLAKRVMASIKQ